MNKLRSRSMLSLLALSVFLLILVACGGNEEAPVDTPTASTPKATPDTQVQDTSRTSLDEYLEFCGQPESEVADFEEYVSLREFSEALGDETERWESVEPPEEVADWHDAVLVYQRALKKELDDAPGPGDGESEDEYILTVLFPLVFEYQPQIDQAISAMDRDVRSRMIAAGCIDEETTGSIPTEVKREEIPVGGGEIPVGGSVEGAVDEPGEADTYLFRAKRGETYVIVATWETLPSIRLEITDLRTFSRVRESGRQPYRISWTAPESSEYYLLVSSGDDLGRGAGSYTVSILIEMILLPPSDVRYAPEGSAIRINWDAVEGADYYNVYHSNVFDSSCTPREGGLTSFCEDLALNVTETTYLHTEPDSETNYYWVAACNSQGCTEVDTSIPAPAVAPETTTGTTADTAAVTTTPTATATPTPTPVDPTPPAPANVRYAIEGSAIRVTWDAVDNADYYNVYHDDFRDSSCTVSGNGGPRFCDELAMNVTEMEYLHADPAHGANYYWVVACNSGGCSDVDSENSATPIVARAGRPTNVRYAVEGSTIRVSWDLVSGADFYNVYYDDFFDSSCSLGTDGSPRFCEELAANVSEATYVHASPDSGDNYYWVVACNRGGCSEVDSENPARSIGTGTVPAPAAAPSADRAALVALYNAMDGGNWRIDRHWLSEEPIDRWYGVTADRNGRITDLDLSGNELSGEIPGELGSLSNLVELDLSRNRLSGAIPPELGNLSNLEWLDLTGNTLTGEIPSELGGLTSLERLFLRANQLTGSIPVELGSLSNLEHLRLNHNQLNGEIPSEIGRLTKLRILALYSNELSGAIPAELGRLTRLFQLGLSNNRLSGEIPPELGNLSNLRWLYLFGNQLTGEIPSALGALANLERLQLQGNHLSGEIPPELGHLANLQVLALHMNQLSGEIPDSLGALTNLERMFLHENQLSGAIPPELGHLTNLEVLALHGNQLSGAIQDTLAALTHLVAVTVCEGNQLSCDIAGVVGEGVAVGVEAVFGVGGAVGNTAGVVGGVMGDVGGVLGDVAGGIFGGWW